MPDSIKQQLAWASHQLSSFSDSARLDSEVLLAFCLQKERSYLMTWPEHELTQQQEDCFKQLITRRLKPEPVAYLIGAREFYSMSFKTTPATLVPRAETELLVDTVLEKLQELPSSAEILDMGCGTGAIALAIKKHAPKCQLLATDIDAETLAVARENAHKHGLDVKLMQSDWFTSLCGENMFDIIVSNPPYIAEDDPYLSQGDLPAEPQKALVSGKTGLDDLRLIISQLNEWLKPGGWIMLEHGYNQAEAVQELLRQQGLLQIQTRLDFNDLQRLTMAQRAVE